MFGYGACEEYAAFEIETEDVSGAHAARFGTFARTDGAAYCATGGLGLLTLLYWYSDLVVLLLFCYRLKCIERRGHRGKACRRTGDSPR